jgi:hypothetical protein
MTETQFKSLNLPRAGADDLDGYLQDRGVPVLRKPEPEPAEVKLAPVPVLQPAPALRRVPVEMPEYLARALRTSAAEKGCTIRFLVLDALKRAGYRIEANDLSEDGRRRGA